MVADELALGVWAAVSEGVGEGVDDAQGVVLTADVGVGEGRETDCVPQAVNTTMQRRKMGIRDRRFLFFIERHPFCR